MVRFGIIARVGQRGIKAHLSQSCVQKRDKAINVDPWAPAHEDG